MSTVVDSLRGFRLQEVGCRRGQMKIMQMSFMIIGVFLFFVLVGLFVLGIVFKDVNAGAKELAMQEAVASIEVIAAMPELNYDERDSMVIDKDKLKVLAGGLAEDYEMFWPIASLEIYKVYPVFDERISCPAAGCNYYDVYDSGHRDVEKFSSYVSICERVREFGYVYDRCEIGKIVVGMKIWDSEVVE